MVTVRPLPLPPPHHGQRWTFRHDVFVELLDLALKRHLDDDELQYHADNMPDGLLAGFYIGVPYVITEEQW